VNYRNTRIYPCGTPCFTGLHAEKKILFSQAMLLELSVFCFVIHSTLTKLQLFIEFLRDVVWRYRLHYNRPRRHKSGVKIELHSFPTSAEGGGVWSAPRFGRFTLGKDPVPICIRLGGTQDRCGHWRNISPLLGFDPRTVQPAASRYNYWAITAHRIVI
jgi:hypothetical protein